MKKLMLLFGVAILLISCDYKVDTIPYDAELHIEVQSSDGQNLLDTTNPNAFDLNAISIIYPMHDGCMVEESVYLNAEYPYPPANYYFDAYGNIKGISVRVTIPSHKHYDSVTDTYSNVSSVYELYDYDNWTTDDRTFYIKWNAEDIDTVVAFYKRTEEAHYRENPYNVLYNGEPANTPDTKSPSFILVIK